MRRRRSTDRALPFRLGGRLLPWPGLVVAVLLVACGGAITPTAPASSPGSSSAASGLGAASAGLCSALGVLPDVAAARTAFVNEAHDALHALAAVPALDRSAAAHVLEAMDAVERDFSGSPAAATLAADLATLRSAADDALSALGIEVPACAP